MQEFSKLKSYFASQLPRPGCNEYAPAIFNGRVLPRLRRKPATPAGGLRAVDLAHGLVKGLAEDTGMKINGEAH